MQHPITKIAIRVLQVLAALAAGYYVVLFIYISVSRLAFPIAIDWVEGAALTQVNHLLAGHGMYVEPSATYTALIYPPLYFYVSAALAKLLGIGFLPLRVTSLLSTCGCMLVIFLITKRATTSTLYAWLSVGLFAATYGSVQSWFDYARVDMLFLLFCLLGLYFLNASLAENPIIAAVFFSLAFFTKQSAIFIIAPVALLYSLRHRKQALIFVALIAIIGILGVLLLNHLTGGWYGYYIFTLPANHILYTHFSYVISLVASMLGPIPLALAIGLIPLVIEAKGSLEDPHYRFFLAVTVATLVVSVISALSPLSTSNAFIPAYAVTAILLGIGLQRTATRIALLPQPENTRTALAAGLLFLCILQFALLHYPASKYLPNSMDWKRANALIKYIEQTPGNILVPTHNYLSMYTNRQPFYHDVTIWELNGIIGSRPLPAWAKIRQEITSLVQSKKISAIYLEKPVDSWLDMSCHRAGVFISNSEFVPTLYKMLCH